MKAHILLSIALTLSTMGCASNAASLQEGAAASAVGGESATGDEPIPASCPDIEVAHANGTLEVQSGALGLRTMLPGGATRRPGRAHQYSIMGSTLGSIEVSFDVLTPDESAPAEFIPDLISALEQDPDITEVRASPFTRRWQGQEVHGFETEARVQGHAMTSLVLHLAVNDDLVSMSVNGPREREEEIESILASLVENTTTECLPAP